MEVVVEVSLLFLWMLSDDVGDGNLDWRKSYRGMGGGTLPLSEGSVLALPSTLLATPASDSYAEVESLTCEAVALAVVNTSSSFSPAFVARASPGFTDLDGKARLLGSSSPETAVGPELLRAKEKVGGEEEEEEEEEGWLVGGRGPSE